MRIILPTLHVRCSAQAVPLAAGNLKAALPKEQQTRTELLDLFPEQSIAEMARQILAFQPQLVAFPLYLWNRQQILLLSRQLRQQQPGLFLLAGGPEASADAGKVIEQGQLDGVICGEGELPFAQLVKSLQLGQPTSAIAGFWPAGSKQAVAPVSCPDLEQLPSPWLDGTLPLTEGCGVLWEVARGCHFNCAFCYDAKGQQGVRPLPTARLHAELQRFVAAGVAQIWVLDSTFNAPPQRGKQLLRHLIEQAPQIHFHLEAKADFLDQETAELLSQLSCSVQIGLQSAEPQVLTPLHRALQPKQMAAALQQLSNQGVTYGLDLIYGLPGDNYRGFSNSLDFTLQQQPNQVDIFPLAVLPGTDLFQRQTEFGITADPEPPYLTEKNNSYSPQEMEQSRLLAAATDIFYNRGRAVGFFLQFCNALSLRPTELLERFRDWLHEQPGLTNTEKDSAEGWQPPSILPLQQAFIAACLRQSGRKKLLALAEDLLNYHYQCAEVLLAEDCQQSDKLPNKKQRDQQRWQRNPQAQVQAFHYDLEELEEIGGEKLSWQIKQLSAQPSYGIFFRQQGQPVIEALQPEFAQLLLAADGATATDKLLTGLDRKQGLELFQFAVEQGLLLPVT